MKLRRSYLGCFSPTRANPDENLRPTLTWGYFLPNSELS